MHKIKPSRVRSTQEIPAAVAKAKAQALAFGPFLFQAVCALRELGVLRAVHAAGEQGVTRAELAQDLGVSPYAATVLLEAGLACEALVLERERFILSKIGYYLLDDEMTRVNVEFARDVCYRPLSRLTQSIVEGKPCGLSELAPEAGDGSTIYEGFDQLPARARQSWLAFDHFYSDVAYASALPRVFDREVRRLLDLGGNTGKFAQRCVDQWPAVEVTIVDLPVHKAEAMKTLDEHGGRVQFLEQDLRSDEPLPAGFDVVWMSQLIDCLSEYEAVRLLARSRRSLAPKGRLFVLEPCWDQQPQAVGRQVLLLTSLYFACMANGNSRMYDSKTLERLLVRAGLRVVARHDGLGVGHSLFECVVDPGESGGPGGDSSISPPDV